MRLTIKAKLVTAFTFIILMLVGTAGYGVMNLMDDKYPVGEPMQIIFCRNVLIYFDKPTQQSVLTRLCDCLADGGYMHINGLLTRRERQKLQTQFPSSAIELRDGPQLRLPSFHSASITAAAANPSATPINGLSTANQKEMFQSELLVEFVFMLFISSFQRSTFHKP